MKIVDESILFFSRVSLSKFSLEALYICGYKGIIVGCVWNAKSQVSNKQGVLATRPRDWNESRVRVAS